MNIYIYRYFEEVVHEYDKAINLYYKGENVSKALDLCFKHQQYDLLGDISMKLNFILICYVYNFVYVNYEY